MSETTNRVERRVTCRLGLVLGVLLAWGWAPLSCAQSNGDYYDTPYFYKDYDSNNNAVTFDFNTFDSAVQSAKEHLAAQYPADPQYCVPESESLNEPQSPGNVAKVDYAPSTSPSYYCPGNIIRVQWTRYDNDPDKNTGDAGDCNGGNGIAGGDTAIICPGTPMALDPINVATGNKYQQDTDFNASPWLTFRRFYNSTGSVAPSTLGPQWRHSFDRSLALLTTRPDGTGSAYLKLFRPDGSSERFQPGSGGTWVADADVADTLTVQPDGSFLVFMGAPKQFERYSQAGLLQSITDEAGQTITLSYSGPYLQTVTDPHGRTLSFGYDGNGNLQTVTLPDGGMLTYGYNDGMLAAVQYPDSSMRQYVYNEASLTSGISLPTALTGVIDEKGVRYESTGYNAQGKAVSTSFAGGVGASSVVEYSAAATLNTPLGASIMFGIQDNGFGALKLSSTSDPCNDAQCKQPWIFRTYDANGWPASFTDFIGNETDTTYNTVGLETQRIEAVGSTNPYLPWQRTTNTTWDTTLRNPLKRITLDFNDQPVAQSAWVYNPRGQAIAHCEIDPTVSAATSYTCGSATPAPAGVRQWTTTYCDAVDTTQCPLIGLALTATGPRSDLAQATTAAYYLDDSASHHHGDLKSITNALGHRTTFLTYDGAGRVLTQRDANGVITTFAYTPRGWLQSRSVGNATTTYTYTPYGAIATVTDPDDVSLTYSYDDAHRLTDITDAQNNHIHYALDLAGNHVGETVYAAGSSTPSRSLTRTYNTLSQLTRVIDGLNHTVFDASSDGIGMAPAGYDPNGNLQYSSDALGIARLRQYDNLDRLQNIIDDFDGTGSTANSSTALSHDALDHLTQVGTADYLSTNYNYDGLGNRTSEQSPDTGTSTDTYDAAGNWLTHTDAKGVVSTSIYDALNRLTGVSYVDSTLDVGYHYDEADTVTGCSSSYPLGRLTRVVESAVTTVYCYDARGNVTRKSQIQGATTDTTSYAYTLANRLSGISTPGQTSTSYTRDSNGRVNGLQVAPAGASTAPPAVVSNISYLPFGPISSYTLGNGQTITRTYDANYALTDIVSPALNLHVARDALGNITALGNAPGANPATETYAYDPLQRLTAVADGGTTLESYTYDEIGDRLSKTAAGLATGTYLYTSGTHQLASIGNAPRANDANGNTTGSVIGGETFGFGYNGRNRLTVAQRNGQTVGTYTYNALGQRIEKVATFPQAMAERYAYDEANQLIGEYGTTNRDYVWMGDVPVAVIDNTINGSVTTSTVNYVTTDQLGTPRAVTDRTSTVIWSWAYQGNPFGEQQPTSSTGYVLNLRSAGEYYDVETGLNSNGFRTREPATWRFLQSDPIGLAGGISTYAVVGNNPLSYVDSLGLQEDDVAEISDYERNRLQEAFAPKLMPQPQWVPATEQEQEAAEGTCPVNPKSWSTARRAYWRNEASNNPYKYSQANLDRMWRGLPPLHDELNVQMELHHVIPRRDGGTHDPSNLQPLWPWEHAEVDPYRYYNGPTPNAGK